MASSAIAADATVVVACAADAAYTVPLAAMLQSVLTSLRPDASLAVHIVDAGIPTVGRERLAELCRRRGATLHWHEPLAIDLAGLPAWGRMPDTTYHRLTLAQLLPAGVRKAIWLDCDLLVMADLVRLWESDLGQHHLLAAQDTVVPFVSSRYGIRRWRELGLPEEAGYFNSGVMLVDLDRWRADEIGSRADRYLRENRDDVVFWDQEGLNAVLCGRWGELDPRWNQPGRASRSGLAAPPSEPWIVHFAGTLKPWLLPEPATGPRALFYRCLDQTPWAGWRPRRSASAVTLGWYESSRLRDLLYPAEPRVMISGRRRLLRVVHR